MNLICNLCFCFIIKWKVVLLSPIQLFYPTNGFVQNASLTVFTNSSQMVYISIIYVRLLVHALWMSISTQQLKLTMFNHVMPCELPLVFSIIQIEREQFHYKVFQWTNCYAWAPWWFENYRGFSLESSWGTCQIQWRFQSSRCHYSSLYFNFKV